MNASDFPLFKQPGTAEVRDGIPYLLIFLAFSVGVYIFETYLDLRQRASFRGAKGTTPPTGVDKETFDKANAYGEDKLNFGLYEGIFSLLVLGVGSTLLGATPYMWTQSIQLTSSILGTEESTTSYKSEVFTAIIFVTIMQIMDMLLNLPFSYVRTFLIEAKHGFNKTTLGLFFKDKVLGIVLSIVIGSPVIAIIIYLCRTFGAAFPFYVWGFLLIFSAFMMMVYPVLIAPLFNTYTKIEDGELKYAVEKLADSIKFPLTALYSMDGSKRSSHSNAFFYGFWKSKRIVLFDTLIDQCTLEELLSILGHELGHWKLNHTSQGFIISQVYMLIFFYSYSLISSNTDLFSSFGFAVDGKPPIIIGLIIFMQSYWAPVDKVLTFVLNINSRINEFAADRFSKDLGHEKGLASGLMTINMENLGNMVPDPWYSTYHFSHPPVVERIKALGVDVTKLQLNKKKSDEGKKSK